MSPAKQGLAQQTKKESGCAAHARPERKAWGKTSGNAIEYDVFQSTKDLQVIVDGCSRSELLHINYIRV